MIRIGPAGWSYPDSPGHLYPADVPARFDALAFLASYFDTIEINSTFYRPQPARTYASWARRAAGNPEFRFTVKLWQLFTHGTTEVGNRTREAPGGRGSETWGSDEVRMVTEGLEVLRAEGRLGALLAQFPWSFKPGPGSREILARLAETFGAWPLVVEVRHAGWGRPEQLALLAELKAGFANIDQPLIGRSLAPTAHSTGGVGYVRFHGRNYENWFGERADAARRYDYLYTAEELAPWVERIRSLGARDGVTDVYVIANNHYEGKGPANALMIRAMLEERKVKAPPVLFDTYRAVLEPYAEPLQAPVATPREDAGDPSLF